MRRRSLMTGEQEARLVSLDQAAFQPLGPSPSADARAAVVGKKVLAGLAKAQARVREVAAERRRVSEAAVLAIAMEDLLCGRPRWGRGGRIVRKLRRQGLSLSLSQVNKILLRLSAVRSLGA